jgi:hypothetical protein
MPRKLWTLDEVTALLESYLPIGTTMTIEGDIKRKKKRIAYLYSWYSQESEVPNTFVLFFMENNISSDEEKILINALSKLEESYPELLFYHQKQ